MEDFDYRSILVDSRSIVQCTNASQKIYVNKVGKSPTIRHKLQFSFK